MNSGASQEVWTLRELWEAQTGEEHHLLKKARDEAKAAEIAAKRARFEQAKARRARELST